MFGSGLHQPELYCTSRPTVVDLSLLTEEGSFSERMDFAWKQDRAFDYMAPFMLRYGADLLAQKTGNQISSAEIRTMEFDTLKTVLRGQTWAVDHELFGPDAKSVGFLKKIYDL